MQIQLQRSQFSNRPPTLRCQEGKHIAEIVLPHWHETYWGGEWRDATISMYDHYPDTPAEMLEWSEFMERVARLAMVFEIATAKEADEHRAKAEKAKQEQEERNRKHDEQVLERCEQLGQYYLQWCRVQREGHKSYATGELEIRMVPDGEEGRTKIGRTMYLKEADGNRWEFKADQVARFEVKNGGRYKPIKLSKIEEA